METLFEGIFTCKQEAVVPVARVAADSLWLGQHRLSRRSTGRYTCRPSILLNPGLPLR